MRLIFPGKNGRVTFLHLLSSNTMPSFGKIQCREVSELLWTDTHTDGLLSQVLAQLKLRTDVENSTPLTGNILKLTDTLFFGSMAQLEVENCNLLLRARISTSKIDYMNQSVS